MAGNSGFLTSIGANAQTLCRKTWWVFLIGGLASLAFGVLALVSPGIALFVLAMFFAASILVDGAFHVIGALGHRGKDGWWVLLLIGLLGLAVGGWAIMNPPLSMIAFVYLVAIQAVVLGVFLLILGYKVRKATTREWILYLTGALSVLAGVLVALNPIAGGLSIVYVIAAWAIAIGALRTLFAFRVRNLAGNQGDRASALG
jgi:uncharacterized membrane protein HdeD (DUF308 family)